MIKVHWFFAACCIFALLITGVQAAVYSADGLATVSLKYSNGDPAPSESFMRMVSGKAPAGRMELEAPPEPDPEPDLINVLTIDTGTEVFSKNLQTPPISNVYVASTITDGINVMQTSNEPGYPVMEIHWDYDKSPSEPWRYYMRVDSLTVGYAVMSEFKTKAVWTQPITATRVNEIINSGTIPEWGTI